MRIIKVATDATVAIIITIFLSSSNGFRLNGLSELLLVAFVERAETLFDGIVEGAESVFVLIDLGREALLVAIIVATVAVVVVVVVVVVVLTDVLDACVVDTNRVIGSSIKKIFVNIGF